MRKILKWIGIVLGGLIGLFVVAFVVLYLIGSTKVNRKYEVPVETIAIPTGPAAAQRGEHLATILLCQRCHGDDLGGQVYFDAPGLVVIPSPNLTSGMGGVGKSYSDEDWVRAIRHGVGADGRGLFFMLSPAFRLFSDQDTGALIAYLKSVPPVDNPLPGRRIEPMARVMMGAGMFPPLAVDQIDHAALFPSAPEPGETTAYGQLLAHTCTECHGANLNGIPFGPPGQKVLSPNLTPGGELANWSEQEFFSTIRTGVTPSGHRILDEMPWKSYGKMTDAELKAVWLFLRSLPALAHGE